MKRTKKIAADCLTPISLYLRLQGKKKVLLESKPTEEEGARFSIIGIDPVKELSFSNGLFSINDHSFPCEDPLKELENHIFTEEAILPGIPFQGGAIGYVGYDVVCQYETLGDLPTDELGLPDLLFYVFELFLVFDHRKDQLTIVCSNAYTNATSDQMDAKIDATVSFIQTYVQQEANQIATFDLEFKSNLTQEEFERRVLQAKHYIQNGDIFQLVLSQRFASDFFGDPFDFYRHLRYSNPSSYMYYLDFTDFQIVGCSPERLVSVKNRTVTTNPIAGTRKRGMTPEEDIQLAEELMNDEKERAEHMMLIDLGRNDIGKVAKIGTVTLPYQLLIEKYQYVMHLVSLVKGELKEGVTCVDALKATLPAGTVSGAPKIRAMQRIYELEPTKRGIYAGAIGYLSMDQQMDFAITIRTMIVKNKKAYVQAGAGIVADSNPTFEYHETIQKAKGLMEGGR